MSKKIKFSIGQMTSNQDGKTSASGTMGSLLITTGTLCFFLGTLYKMFWKEGDIELITQSIIVITVMTV